MGGALVAPPIAFEKSLTEFDREDPPFELVRKTIRKSDRGWSQKWQFELVRNTIRNSDTISPAL